MQHRKPVAHLISDVSLFGNGLQNLVADSPETRWWDPRKLAAGTIQYSPSKLQGDSKLLVTKKRGEEKIHLRGSKIDIFRAHLGNIVVLSKLAASTI